MYDFETLIDRRGTGAAKWSELGPYELEQGILPLSVADMEFRVPPCVEEACVAAARHGIYGYTMADEPYQEAVLDWMQGRHGLQAKGEDILIVRGVVPALGVAIRALTKPGEGVIIQPPVYPPFFSTVEQNGRRVEACPLRTGEQGYEMDFEALERAARKEDVSLMLLCSPHNPVGRVWTREELTRLDGICRGNDVVIVADEIHGDLVPKGRHICFATLSQEAARNCILCTAPSKTFNIPGLQTSNIFILNPEIRERVARQARLDGCCGLSWFGRAATIAAYREGEAWLEACLRVVASNYGILRTYLGRLPGVKLYPMEGTYLAWADFRALGMEEKELESFLRERAHMFTDEGYSFGQEGSGFERFNLALPEKALRRQLDMLLAAWEIHCEPTVKKD
ncbi:MAG: pyridoxal phosphate-dependent aminotransferase [Clostridiales bacterium]|nr:MalY/PatB family protein [Bacillota bacterium]NLL55084.1 pyridoxal phosphate-dependent aminotransferase [Clostridiales bacterium]